MKAKIYTLNAGRGQFFGLYYADSDVCIMTGWRTSAGAEKWAKENGYELVE